MTWSTPDLCDGHGDALRVLAPVLRSFGGIERYGGEVLTLACFEDNSLVKRCLGEPGRGRVLVVDGGGSVRRALLGDQIARQAAENGWSAVVVNGAVRDVDVLRETALGIHAVAAIPVRTVRRGLGDLAVPVTVAGVTIRTGDWLYADATGLVVADHALPGWPGSLRTA